MKKVWIIIVNYNCEEHIKDCLSSIKNLQKKTYLLNVVIVDNNSKKESLLAVKKYIEKESNFIALIENKINQGFSGGNNKGIIYAIQHGAEYLICLNSDTLVDKNLVEELLKEINSNQRIGVVVPKIYFAKGFEFHKERYKKEQLGRIIWYAGGKMDWNNILGIHRGVDEVDEGQYNKKEESEIATGCCMLVKKEVFEKIGLFEKRYFLYYEDADLSMRIKKAGYKIVYIPEAVVWHKNAGSTGGSGSELQDYYITRNRLLFGMRYAPFRTKLALLRESFVFLQNGRYWQKRGVIDYFLKRLGKGSFQI